VRRSAEPESAWQRSRTAQCLYSDAARLEMESRTGAGTIVRMCCQFRRVAGWTASITTCAPIARDSPSINLRLWRGPFKPSFGLSGAVEVALALVAWDSPQLRLALQQSLYSASYCGMILVEQKRAFAVCPCAAGSSGQQCVVGQNLECRARPWSQRLRTGGQEAITPSSITSATPPTREGHGHHLQAIPSSPPGQMTPFLAGQQHHVGGCQLFRGSCPVCQESESGGGSSLASQALGCHAGPARRRSSSAARNFFLHAIEYLHHVGYALTGPEVR